MTEIHIGTISPMKKKAKTIYEAVAKSIPGDVIVLHTDIILNKGQALEIPHHLVISSAYDKTKVSIKIPSGTVGLYLEGSNSVTLENIKLKVDGQANGIMCNQFSGKVELINSELVYITTTLLFRDRNVLFSSGQDYAGNLSLLNSVIESISATFNQVQSLSSIIGKLPIEGGPATESILYAEKLSFESTELNNLIFEGQVAEYLNISTKGILSPQGQVTINNIGITPLELSKKDLSIIKKISKKDPRSAEQAPLEAWYCFNLSGEDNSLTLNNATLEEMSSVELGFGRALLSLQDNASIKIKNGHIAGFDYQSQINSEGHMNYTNVVDESGYDITQKPQIHGVKSISPLLEQVEVEANERRESSESLDELNAMIGLQEPKDKIARFAATEKMKMLQMKRGLGIQKHGLRNMIFAGPPGTGKTTVAKKMANILYDMGAIERNVVVETTPVKLKSDHVGGSGKELIKKCEEALGGILFINEAYSLNTDDPFAKDIVDELITWTDEAHSEGLIVILAGYKEDIEELIHQTNPGLSRRFPNWINFYNYSNDELKAIAGSMLNQRNVLMTQETVNLLVQVLDQRINEAKTLKTFGNASFVGTFINKLIEERDVRLAQISNSDLLSDQHLMAITAVDVAAVANLAIT